MYDIIDISNELLYCAENQHPVGELMSLQKLEKMLYYEQGFHLAKFGTPLFEDNLIARLSGPSADRVREYYSTDRYDEVTLKVGINYDRARSRNFSFDDILDEELFLQVFNVYSKFSAYGLILMIHSEKPWINTPLGTPINQEIMQEFFKTRIK